MDFTNLFDFEVVAAEQLAASAYEYFRGGAADEVTMAENRNAFDRIALYPRTLRDVSQRDLSTTVLGEHLAMPVVIAPMALSGLAHPDGDCATARAVQAAGLAMTVSTMSSQTVEESAEIGAPLWFQLYIQKDRGLTADLVKRAEAAGCKALVVTVDAPVPGLREGMVHHPVSLDGGVTLANLSQYYDPARYPSVMAYAADQIDPSVTWTDLEQFAASSALPVLVKGLLRADDAVRALDAGVKGIIVSNHGGRQLDTAPATAQVLPRIAEHVDGRCTLLMDGSVRRGTDIVKALAMGADAVMLGRPVMWGLAAGGADGVAKVLSLLRHEFDVAMALTGCASVDDITDDLLTGGS